MRNAYVLSFKIWRIRWIIFLQGKKVIILLELEVLQSGKDVGGKIDTPISINPDGTVPPGSGDENKRPTNNAPQVWPIT